MIFVVDDVVLAVENPTTYAENDVDVAEKKYAVSFLIPWGRSQGIHPPESGMYFSRRMFPEDIPS